MKEVVKVSISGIAFSFAPDAYEVMKSYLDRLEAGYAKQPDGREIVADIEARIAELILNEQESDSVVSRQLAESVVAQLGFPDELEEHADSAEKLPKRLYRNPEGAVLGGVCSGLGTYFRTDPVWIRLAFFLPLLLIVLPTHGFFGSLFVAGIVLYLILWIAIPMARTPRQRLEMQGERVTASSIRENFADDASAMPPAPKRQRSATVWADLVYAAGRILLFLLKTAVFFIVLGVSLAAIGCLIALFALLISEELPGSGMVMEAFAGLEGITPGLYTGLLLIAVLIPLLLIDYFLLTILFGSRANRTFLLAASVLWIVLIVYLSVTTLRNADNLHEGARQLGYDIEEFEEFDDFYDRHRNVRERTGAWNRSEEADDDPVIEELSREYLEEEWDENNADNIRVEITEEGDRVVIRKVVVHPDNPADTLSDERIVVGRHTR